MSQCKMRLWIIGYSAAATLASAGFGSLATAADEVAAGISVQRIWDKAPHNAFTDLIHFRDRFYCVFREGSGHVPGESGTDGKIRIIASGNADDWRSVALLEEEGVDLRDPKLSITPDGRLMVVMGGSVYDGNKLLRRASRVAFSNAAGTVFGKPTPVVLDEELAVGNDWLWRVTWHGDIAYGAVYQATGDDWNLQLVQGEDGIHYEHVTQLMLDGRPNEATIRFRDDGEMLMVVRRAGGNRRGAIGRSHPPYTEWKWQEMTHRLGGPNFVIRPSERIILGTRKYGPGGTRTIIGSLSEDGSVHELVELPSGGDTSYAGMLVHEGELFVSYYSSHEENTSIYLARIPLQDLLSIPGESLP